MVLHKLNTKHGRWASVALAGAVSLGILIVLFWKVGVRFKEVKELWREANKSLLFATFAFSFLWHEIVGTDKWYRILKRLGAPVSWFEVLTVRLGSDPIRFAAPFKSGELFNAAWFYGRGYLDFPRSLSSILFDKTLNFIGTLYWLFLGLILLGRVSLEQQLLQLLLMLVFGMGLICLLVFEPLRAFLADLGGRVHPKARKLVDGGLAPFREMTVRQKIFFLLYGIFFQLRPLLVLYLLFRTFGIHPPFSELVTFGSIVVLMSNIPYTTAGIGPREVAVTALFAAYADKSMLPLIGILMSFSIHIAPAIIGIPFAPRIVRVAIEALKKHQPEARR